MENSYTSKAGRIASIIMRWFVILFMLFDAIIKFIKPQPVIQTTINEMGYQEHHILVHGLSSLICTLLFMFPRTSILGAILMTGHLGGAIASHLRVDNPLFSNTLFPVYIGVMMWGSLWLQTTKVRNLLPLVR
jgi:DoxX-like family